MRSHDYPVASVRYSSVFKQVVSVCEGSVSIRNWCSTYVLYIQYVCTSTYSTYTCIRIYTYVVHTYVCMYKYLVQNTDVFFFGLGDEDMVFREWESDLREK